MGWDLRCEAECGLNLWVKNIVDLIDNRRDEAGLFRCECGSHAYIAKHFQLQEEGEVWAPFLRGVIPLGESGSSYQPFVFLVSYKKDSEIAGFWFSYYKDLRGSGGRLKLGYGPGGPPVLNIEGFLGLLSNLVEKNHITQEQVIASIAK